MCSIDVACTQPNPGFAGAGSDSAPREARTSPDRKRLIHDGPDVGPIARPDLRAYSVDRMARGVDDALPPDTQLSPDLSPDLPSPCDPGETAFGGHCYRAASGLLLTYSMARGQCLQGGGLPASISCPAEQAFVSGLASSAASQGAWIGLVRTGPGKSDFAWESGDPLGYTDWAPGEPNNQGNFEGCVLIWGPAVSSPQLIGKWNDAPCAVPRDAVVCERVPY